MDADEWLFAGVGVDVLLEVLREGEALMAILAFVLLNSEVGQVVPLQAVLGSIDVLAHPIVTMILLLASDSGGGLHLFMMWRPRQILYMTLMRSSSLARRIIASRLYPVLGIL